MAITVTGSANSAFDDNTWSKMMDAVSPPVVASGFTATAKPSSTRTLTLTGGTAYGAGAWVTMDTSTDVTFAANTSGQPRVDLVCLRVDFNADPGSQATAPVVKQGTPNASPNTPSLTRTPGGIYEIPLWRVPIANGATQLSTGSLIDARSLPSERVTSGIVTLPPVGSDGTSTVTVNFPKGFFTQPPRVQLTAQTGAALTTTVHLWPNTISSTTFNANMARSNNNDCLVHWTATGY